jgi:hypothetical protein
LRVQPNAGVEIRNVHSSKLVLKGGIKSAADALTLPGTVNVNGKLRAERIRLPRFESPSISIAENRSILLGYEVRMMFLNGLYTFGEFGS